MDWMPRNRDDVPDALDQLAAQVRQLMGDDTNTYMELCKLYAIACRELAEIDDAEACGTLSDTEEYAQAHACGQFADAMAINRSRQ